MLNWHRKARKTTLAINQLIRWAATNRAPFWYVGPSYGLAKKTVWDDPRMFPQYIPEWNVPNSTFIKKSETELRIDFKGSGGQIYVFGADRPDLMRGPNPMGVILDEYSVQKEKVWNEIIQPIMRANPQAWCWFLFTPRGKNHAFTAFQYGQRGDSEWKSWQLKANESGIFTPESLDNARRDMPQATFQQELMCEFLEGEGSVFRHVRGIATAVPQPPKSGHYYTMGVDLAKVQDFTVLSVFDRDTNAQVYQDRFQTLEWPFQKKKILETAKHYNNALMTIDATGVGDPIVDDLMRSGGAVEPYKLTNESKKALIEKLSIWIEQSRVKLLPISESLLEYDNYAYEITPQGRVIYNAPQGFHDDIVISHALGIWGLQPLTKRPDDQEPTPVQTALQQALQRAYGNGEDELDLEAV